MFKEIRKKILPEYFNDILIGKKKYELRLNDFEIKEGDTLVLEEWDQSKNKYTGRKIEKRVIGVAKFDINKLFWPKEEISAKGLQIISFE